MSAERDPADPYARLAAEVRAFAERCLAPGIDEAFLAGRSDPAAIRALASAGHLGLTLPPRYGGRGLDYRALAVLCEELARVDVAHQITVTVHLALSAMTILQWGTDEQRERWLPRLARGEVVATFGLTEPDAGSDVGALRATARRDGDGYVLNGEKAWISLAGQADVFLVFATIDRRQRHRGITAFIVERGTPGVGTTTYHGKLGVRAGDTGSVALQDVRVGERARLGEEGEGFAIAMAALGNGLFTVGAGAVGVGQAAVDATRALLASQGAARPGEWAMARLATMATGVERARLLIHRAAELKNRGEPSAQATSLAKWQAAEAAMAACEGALELHELFGVPPFPHIERHLANVKGSVIYGGTREIHTGMQGAYALGYRSERPSRCPAPTAAELAGN